MQQNTLPLEKKNAQAVLNCYNSSSDYNAVHQCVETCHRNVQQVAKRVTSEFEALQSSVQACQQSCVKKIEPRFASAQGNPDQEGALKKEFEQCALRCIKEAEPLLKPMEQRINSTLKETL